MGVAVDQSQHRDTLVAILWAGFLAKQGYAHRHECVWIANEIISASDHEEEEYQAQRRAREGES